MATLYLTHDICIEHDTGPGHPERPDRLRAIKKVMDHEIFDDLIRVEAPLADVGDIERAHPGEYIDAIREAVPEEGLVRVDGDTVLSPEKLGRGDAGGRVGHRGGRSGHDRQSRKRLLRHPSLRPSCGTGDRHGVFAFSTISPSPGFTPGPNMAANGSPLSISTCITAMARRRCSGPTRTSISGPPIRCRYFPGTGAISESGVGNICNAPLSAGDDGAIFREAFESRILPALRKHRPNLILISAGFDAHERDPLGSLRLVEEDFGWATSQIADIADNQCDGRIVSMLEGGYDLEGLAKSVAVHVRTLMDAGA